VQTLQAWSAQRTYPDENFPSQGYYDGFIHSKRVLKKVTGNVQAADTWKSMGPANYGGRTNALAIDPRNPNILYAGSASGGLWRMTMSGNSYTWNYIDTHFPVLGVNAIAIDPADSKTLYIGTGEVYGYQKSIGSVYERLSRGSYGIGILKSVDSGLTWNKSLDWTYQQQRGVLCLRINPLNPKVVFAGTSEGVYKSTDAGVNWVQVHSVLMAVDIAFKPGDTTVMYVSCGNLGSNGMGVYRSLNSGAAGSFQKLGGGLPGNWTGKTMLAVCPDRPNALYADIGNDTSTLGLYYSGDQGSAWTLRNDSNYAGVQGWFSHYVRPHPQNCENLMIGGQHFYRSNDGGRTIYVVGGQWPNNTLHLDHHAFANSPVDMKTIYIGHDGGVSRTRDGGETFESMKQGYITTQCYPGFSTSQTDSNLAIAGLQDNQILVYRGTENWTLYTTGDGTYTAIDPNNNQILYAANQNLWMIRSDNGGQNWTYITGAIFSTATSAFVAPFILSPSQPTTLYAGGNMVFKTLNRGAAWTVTNAGKPIGGGNAVAMGISHTNANILYVTVGPTATSRSEVYKTINGGTSWTNITGTLPNRFYMDAVVSSLDDKQVYLTLSGFGSSHLYWTKDGGTTWADIGQGLPDVPTSAVMLDPGSPEHLYVGNDLGVYVSTNHGLTWSTFSENLPSAVMVVDLAISRSNKKIRAATHGNGVYERALLPSGFVAVEGEREAAGYRLWQQSSVGKTSIRFSLAERNTVSLMLYDLGGKLVKSWPVKSYPAGESAVIWDGRINSNRPATDEMYICKMQAGKVSKSMTLRHGR
jgi:photosystem II stability/assembly factor-like uncharacterized protein